MPVTKTAEDKRAAPKKAVQMITPKKLKGFRDYGPKASLTRQHIIQTLWQTAKTHGFEPIDTPVLEYAEILMGSGGTETDKEVYSFSDNGGRDVAMRFDLTVPFARYVAETQGTMILPFKRLQIGEVFRGEKPQKGRYRQFCQGDFDIIGPDTILSDVEILQFLKTTLEQLVPAPTTIYLSHREILSGLITHCVPDLEDGQEAAMLIWIDKWDKIPRDKLVSGLSELPGSSAESAEQLVATLTELKSPKAPIAELLRQMSAEASADLIAAAERFDTTLALLQAQQSSTHAGAGTGAETGAKNRVKFQADLSIARGLGYYTGIVMETKIDSLPNFGSIASGGRYNGLVSRFSKREFPGVGGSIGVDRLLAALEELDAVQNQPAAALYLALFDDEGMGFALELATRLRRAGVATDITLKPGKIAQQFKYADKKGIPLVIAIGSEEQDSGKVTIKRLGDGSETKGVATGDTVSLVETITSLLS